MTPPPRLRPLLLEVLAGRRAPAALPTDAWAGLVETARREALGPALAAAVRGRGAPPDVEAALVADRRAGAAAALAARARTAAAVEAIGRARVEAIVLKGWPLAVRLWGDDALRPCEDCDLLVRLRDRDRASAALAAAGFRPVGHHAEIHHGPLGAVDLHVDLVNAERVPARAAAGLRTDRVWNRARAAEVGGLRLRLLDPVDEVVYLAAHAVLHHGLGRLLLLLDLDRAIRRLAAADDAVVERAADLGGGRPLGLALEALRLGLGATDRPGLAARLPRPGRIDRSIVERAVRRGGRPTDRYLLALLGMPWRARLAFVRQSAAPAPSVLREVAAARGPRRPTAALYARHALLAVRGCGDLLAAVGRSALKSGAARV